MHGPDRIYRLQAKLGELHGLVKLYPWLIGIAVVIFAVETVEFLLGRAHAPSLLGPPALLASSLLGRSSAKRRIREIETELAG
jgi:hypothetical protein